MDKLDQWIGNLKLSTVGVYLPRFKMTSAFQLSQLLMKLGMTDAFSPTDADFSGMTGKKDCSLARPYTKLLWKQARKEPRLQQRPAGALP